MAGIATLPRTIYESLEGLRPDIRAAAAEAEELRTVPPALVERMKQAGFFRLWVPEEYGGQMVDMSTMAAFIDALAQIDGGIAWTVMIGTTGGAFAGQLPPDRVREIFADPNTIIGGSVIPRGQADVVDGGYRVSGRWPFASGCLHTTWLLGNSRVMDNGQPSLLPNGAPAVRAMLAPRNEFEILDTWRSPGLRGSGSHDIQVSGIFVPGDRTVAFGPGRPVRSEPLYQLPIPVLLGFPIGAVALGLTRASIDAFEALASSGCTPSLSGVEIRSRASIQGEVGRCEAALAAARSFYFEVAQELSDSMATGDPLPQALNVRRILAASHASDVARDVTSRMFQLGGSSVMEAPNTLERCFRDAHVVAQHMVVAPATWESAGRHYLGPPDRLRRSRICASAHHVPESGLETEPLREASSVTADQRGVRRPLR
ncbi:MAG TPA: acyl-CoA dehydrogenase family protein [Dehalococcoidia bacterium]|nr:acyl-CoA dehydrogenase family protein [Dehalococcoidia bacterium]